MNPNSAGDGSVDHAVGPLAAAVTLTERCEGGREAGGSEDYSDQREAVSLLEQTCLPGRQVLHTARLRRMRASGRGSRVEAARMRDEEPPVERRALHAVD